MSRKFSTIEISDVVDQNGAARYGFEDVGAPINDNATIAPWLDEPSAELRKSKSSLNLFSKLKSRPSKVHLRNGSEDSEHPSLRPPVPPLPEKKTSSIFNITLSGPPISVKKEKRSKGRKGSDSEDSEHPSLRPPVPPLPEKKTSSIFNITLPGPPISAKKEKRSKGKKGSEEMSPPSPPPETDKLVYSWDKELKGPMNVDAMNGIIDFSIATAGTDHSFHSPNFLLPSEFSNPFSSTPVQEKRKAIIPSHGDYCKVSPKTLLPPYGLIAPSTADKSGPGSPTWVPPESWAVENPYNPSGNPELSEAPDSGSDDNLHNIPSSLVNGRRRTMGYDVPKSRKGKQPNAVEHRITFKVKQPPPDFSYRMKIYRQDNSYHVVAIKLRSTVSELNARLARKLLSADDRVQYNLYLKERGQERMLGQHESPAAIVKLRMEQAGYDFEDGTHLLGIESLGILARFLYKSQLLAGEDQISFDTYDFVDLSGRGLRTIPVVLHQNADAIISLRLSRNPMIEIPLDFIQACTTLRELRLTHMYMKKVPQSLRHSQTLHRLDLSCNSIKDLDEAYLDQIQGLLIIFLQNNRLEKLPWHFPRLRSLVTLNISNNKFRTFPLVVAQLESLRHLDISFNMITELPEEIGRMMMLEQFILLGNQVTKFPLECCGLVNLRVLDCRRNQISDLTPICMLPQIANLSASHNAVHALDLSLGPDLTTLDASHNDITQLSLLPGPMGKPPFALTSLDISYAKLSSLDIALGQLSSLRTLKFDHNSIRSIPDTLGDLKWLETLSCTDNKLDALPSTIGKLQKLEVLDAHNNSLTELPQSIWNCASLTKINITSNLLGSWHDPPVVVQETDENSNFSTPSRRISGASIASTMVGNIRPNYPPLVYSLEKLYLGENCLTDNVILPLMIFKELRVLNLSFNEIQDLPPAFFRNMVHLEELYLSGNRLTSIPSEDLHRLSRLTTLYLNGNKLHTLPQELGKVVHLTILDVGSNFLKYNINNWEFDWNWNFNTNLKYLNLSGNKRLQIKGDPSRTGGHVYKGHITTELSGFTSLKKLKVLGLMDVTITPTAKDTAVDIPDETADRRIRTSLSTVCGMGYGIADSLGKSDMLNMVDLVHEFHGRKDEALFAMFGRTDPCKGVLPGTSTNHLSKFLHDHFVGVFMTQMAAIKEKQLKEGVPEHQWNDGIPKALHWTFLKLNQDLHESLRVAPRKNSQASINSHVVAESQLYKAGVSGIVLYFVQKTLFAANVGDALAVVSRQGVAQEVSRKHDPYDRLETARIRAAEGYISPPGLVNDEVDVSRSFGFFREFPTLNAKPDIFVYNLSEMDEFVIIANCGLWDFVPFQTAVDIARTVVRMERPDPMLAAQKLRDFAISYGADGSTMIMVISLFDSGPRSRQPTLDPIADPHMYRSKKKDEVRDRGLNRLHEEVSPPTGQVTIVFTDIRNSTHLWEANPGMATAMRLHNSLLRRQLRFCGGYEVKTEGDAFMCSFPTALAAVWWCLSVQRQLLEESWPLEILECEDGKPIYDSDEHLIARGLSVRMGIHSGLPLCETDPITHRMDYFGPMVNRSARINGCALGGQIMCSSDIILEINAKVLDSSTEMEFSKEQSVEAIRRIGVVVIPMGEYKMKGIELPELLSVIYPMGLEGRHELKETPVEAVGSRVQFSIPQMQELGLLCLRIEAISSGRVFKPTPERKGSIQSGNDIDRNAVAHTFIGDPNVLLPPINDTSSDSDLMLLLDSLTLRIENAVNTLYMKLQNYGVTPCSRISQPTQILPGGSTNASTLVDALMEEGVLDESILKYISSVMRGL